VDKCYGTHLSSSTTLPIPQQLAHPFCSNQLSYDESTAYQQQHTYRATHLYTIKQRASPQICNSNQQSSTQTKATSRPLTDPDK
jgi:hypothetical protein